MENLQGRLDGASDKTSASDAGGMGFKSRADQISHTLPWTRHRCKPWCVGPDAKPRGIKRVGYNDDFIWKFASTQLQQHTITQLALRSLVPSPVFCRQRVLEG